MDELYQLLSKFKTNSNYKYQEIFNKLKKYFISKLTIFLDDMKKNKRGRKRSVDLDRFLTCLFFITDNGMKMSYIKDYFHIPKSTYYYYFDLITKNKFFNVIYEELIHSYAKENQIQYLITDTFTVKSMLGSKGLGRSCTDRGRKALKVSLICDQNLVTHAVHLNPANVHDSKILIPTIGSSVTDLKGKYCLADSGYAGSTYISNIEKHTGIKLLSKPKRTCNKLKMSHYVTPYESDLIKKKRNNIERLNGNIRNFRSLMIKYTKSVASYSTYLYMSLIVITCYNINILLNTI
jgi:hypothetical protein